MALCPVWGAAPGRAESLPVGIYPAYPPLDMRNVATGELEGFDVDLARALLGRMGREGRFVETAFAQLIPSLTSGRIGLFLNGMMDTPARRASLAFVDYLQSGVVFVTLAAGAEEEAGRIPADLPALCGRRVAVSRITTQPAQLLQWSDRQCVAHGLPPVVLFAAENSADARLQLREGRVAAVLQDSLTTPWVIALSGGRFVPLGAPFDSRPLGIGLSKGEPELSCAVRRAFAVLVADGTYRALLARWHLPPESAVEATAGDTACPT